MFVVSVCNTAVVSFTFSLFCINKFEGLMRERFSLPRLDFLSLTKSLIMCDDTTRTIS